ncbi:MAG: ComF family protein [Candidatus Doudnabacteria bacterium]|nr:ComF family protein [Candidatus Doudnabacteria bacterium]
MKFIPYIKTLGRLAADLVFPISCIICGQGEKFLCESCQAKLTRLDKQLCVVCKKPAAYGKTHSTCVTRNTLDGIISALSYTDKRTKKLIGTFKYQFISDLAAPMSHMIVEEITKQGITGYFAEFTIIPVPLHKRRLNWRGFNQAELLAEALGKNLNIPVDKTLVTRAKFTTPQIELKAEQRKTNIENAFETKNTTVGRYLLVDDVVTTGSTLNEIAKLLKKHGATEVWAATSAHG